MHAARLGAGRGAQQSAPEQLVERRTHRQHDAPTAVASGRPRVRLRLRLRVRLRLRAGVGLRVRVRLRAGIGLRVRVSARVRARARAMRLGTRSPLSGAQKVAVMSSEVAAWLGLG